MQIVYRQHLEFSAARQLAGQWRGDNFVLSVESLNPISPDQLGWIPARFGAREIILKDQDPSTLHLAQTIWAGLADRLPLGDLVSLDLTPEVGETVSIESSQTWLTTQAIISAAHRTHAPRLSDAENVALYGKCDNLNGHGHNYLLQVVRPATLAILDGFQALFVELDHKNLSLDIPDLSGHNVVTETLAAFIARRLPQAARVRVYETHDFYAEYQSGAPDFSLGREYKLPLAYQLGDKIQGHTFTVQVVVQGPLDPFTETAYDLGALDSAAYEIFAALSNAVFVGKQPVPPINVSILYNLVLYLWEQFQTKLNSALLSIELSQNRNGSLVVSR